MTEQEWLTCDSTAAMMIFLGKRLSHRKQQLFVSAIFRLFREYVSDEWPRRFCEVLERFGDGQASQDEMDEANQATADKTAWNADFEQVHDKAFQETSLLRHIYGNPFRSYTAPMSWPSTIVQLTESLYSGEDCRLPLSDALEECGLLELAQHFRAEEWHPKGCWAMDLVLDKE